MADTKTIDEVRSGKGILEYSIMNLIIDFERNYGVIIDDGDQKNAISITRMHGEEVFSFNLRISL